MAFKKKYLLNIGVLLLLSICLRSYGETIHIEGRVLDEKGQPLPFVSIQIEGDVNGTVTNEQGYFNLAIKHLTKGKLIVSCLGYKTYYQKINADNRKIEIILEADAKQLDEVFIFTDSSLKVLLAKAYHRINDNYPKNSIELTGFYISYHKSATDNRYLDFSESSLKIQQSGYQNSKEDAQIEVLKIRNLRFPQRDSVDNVRYYGGPFMANWNDPVKMRESFLNPATFNNGFVYQLESISKYNGGNDSVYVIGFKSADKHETKTGKIWIDKKTLAYEKIEWTDKDPKNPNPLTPIKRVFREYLTLYQRQNNEYVLKYTSIRGKNYNSKTKKENTYALEFVTTNCEITTNPKPIPLEKRLKYGELFTELESSEDKHFWDEYTTIEMDSALKIQRSILSRDEIAKDSYSNLKEVKSKTSFKIRIHHLLKAVTIGYALTGSFFKSKTQEPVVISYVGQTSQDTKKLSRSAMVLGTSFNIGYEINPYQQLRVDLTDGIFNSTYHKSTTLKFYQYFLVKTIGNPVFITASIGTSFGKTGFRLGGLSSGNDMVVNGKNLGKQFEVFVGERQINGQIGLGVEYRKKRLSYFGEMNYTLNIYQKDMLLLRMNKNPFFSKTDAIDYPSNEILISPEKVYSGVSPLFMAFGVRIRL